jgi:hypothetical protein
VTVAVGKLPADALVQAMDGGAAEARRLRMKGLIEGAALSLAGTWRIESGGTSLAHLEDRARNASGPDACRPAARVATLQARGESTEELC